MADQTFRAIITVLDRATAPLRAIRDRIDTLGRSTGLNAIGRAAGTATLRVRDLGQQLTSLALPLGVLSAAGGIAALTSTVQGSVAAARQMGDVWAQLGATTDRQRGAIDALRYSVQQAGGTAEEASGALVRLRDVLAAARRGEDDQAAGLFRHLGIALRDRNGPRQAIDVLPQLARAFERVENPVGRARMAMVAFGNASPAMIRGIAELAQNAQRLGNLGLVAPSPQEVKNLESLGRASTDVGLALGSLRDAIGAQLAPVLTPLVEDFSKWVASNREIVALNVAEAVRGIAEALKQINWEEFWKGAGQAARSMKGLYDSLGGSRTAGVALAAVLAGPLVAGIAGVTTALGALAVAIAVNPIGAAIVAGAAAIAGAAALIYRNWSGITGFFGRIWTRIRDGFGPQVAWLRDVVVGAFTWAANDVTRAWESVAQTFEVVWRNITGPFLDAWRQIEPVLRELGVIGSTAAPQGQGALSDPDLQRLRRERFRDRATGGGVILQNAPGPGAAAGGQLDVRVRFENAPAGLRAEASSRGTAIAPPVLEVGYNFGRAYAT